MVSRWTNGEGMGSRRGVGGGKRVSCGRASTINDLNDAIQANTAGRQSGYRTRRCGRLEDVTMAARRRR